LTLPKIGNREAPAPSNCLGVFGLSSYTTEKELEAEFSKYGALEKVHVVLDSISGRSRGFGFIYFEEVKEAMIARYGNMGYGKFKGGVKVSQKT